ncbi:MAG: hypothetical protein QOI31_2242 [Solirubrobacterales bacterium]|nr:hypothetical protein [Solirubrobacterales bacterium]
MRGHRRELPAAARRIAGLRGAWAIALGIAFAIPANASAAVTLNPGVNTVTTPNFELNFGNDLGVESGDGNTERVDTLRWRDSGGTLRPNVTAPGLAGFCPTGTGPGHFWGQSYADHDGGSPAPVMAGSVGDWEPIGERTVKIETVAPQPCVSSNPAEPPLPVRSRYTFFESAAKRNVIRVDRRWEFGPGHSTFNGTHGLRAYVPRLSYFTYSEVIYPNAAESTLITTSSSGPAFHTDWNNEWVALNAPGDSSGLMIIRDASNTSPATVVTDNDGGSNSNLSGVTLVRPDPDGPGPLGGWHEPLNEIEYLCFYDATSWPVATRLTTMPDGCAVGTVPINTAIPSVSGDEGNPQPGVTYNADPGTWENRDSNVPFTYQWLRCDADTCAEIGGATSASYQALAADFGKQLRVRVTATAVGGETESARSQLLGSLSGTIYVGPFPPGTALGGARVQACLGTLEAPTDCRTTVADGSGQYTFVGLEQGSYYVRGYPPAGSQAIPVTRSTSSVVTSGDETSGQDVVLKPPAMPPSNASFTGPGFRYTTAAGVPVVHWQEPWVIEVDAPIDADVDVEIDYPDDDDPPEDVDQDPDEPEPDPEDPTDGEFDFPVDPQYPDHGPADIDIDIDPDGDGPLPPEETDPFPIYIDPSGFVREDDGTPGTPIAGATVQLFRSDFADSALSLVPNGSDIMSPSNRTNPDTTDSGGHFGWDVIAGFYTVRASKDGCRNPEDPDQDFVETQVYEIPPPVTDVDLRLDCDPLKVLFEGPTDLGKIKVPKSREYELEGVTAECPDGSDGDCEVTLDVKSGNTKLGKATLTGISIGNLNTLTGKLSKKGMKKLKKAEKMKAEITATGTVPDPDGEDSTQVYTAKLIAK